MTPAELSLQLQRRISVIRGNVAEVEAHARKLKQVHVLELIEPPASAAPSDLPLATTPAQLSDALLQALFGTWPPARSKPANPPSHPRASVVVREATWAEWERALNPDRPATGQ